MLTDSTPRRISVSITALLSALLLLITLVALLLYTPGVAADDSVLSSGGQFPLIVGTSLNPTGTNHDVFEIDVVGDTFQSLFTTFPVGGATYDAANGRVLFTSSSGSSQIDQLWEWPVGGVLNNLGTIMNVTGTPLRMDGLAMSGGMLYGSRAAGASDGIYEIDITTLVATLVLPTTNSISGIDADPVTGIIYGADDTALSLVEIDVAGGTITPVTAYPGGQTDIDGLAVSDDGFAYLVTDEPGSLYVYNLVSGVYETPLTAPWTSADTFSGGAYISAGDQPAIAIDKTPDNQSVFSGGDANFTIYVTNTGNVTLTSVMVSDPLVPACDGVLGDLQPGASASYLCTDVGVTMSYTNTADVTGLYMNQVPITDTDTAVVTVVAPPPASIVLTKTVGLDPAVCATGNVLIVSQPNTDVTYCYTVLNTGDITLTIHDLVDDQLGDILVGFPYDLAPGATAFLTQTTNIVTSVTNVATWTATVPGGPVVSASASATVTEAPTDVNLSSFGGESVALLPWLPLALLLGTLALALLIRRRYA